MMDTLGVKKKRNVSLTFFLISLIVNVVILITSKLLPLLGDSEQIFGVSFVIGMILGYLWMPALVCLITSIVVLVVSWGTPSATTTQESKHLTQSVPTSADKATPNLSVSADSNQTTIKYASIAMAFNAPSIFVLIMTVSQPDSIVVSGFLFILTIPLNIVAVVLSIIGWTQIRRCAEKYGLALVLVILSLLVLNLPGLFVFGYIALVS